MEPSTNKARAVYTCDVSDAEWEFCQPYLELMRPDAPQRLYPMRELFNALRLHRALWVPVAPDAS